MPWVISSRGLSPESATTSRPHGGVGNTAVRGTASSATAGPGDDNEARVDGDDSHAGAGLGDGLAAATGATPPITNHRHPRLTSIALVNTIHKMSYLRERR